MKFEPDTFFCFKDKESRFYLAAKPAPVEFFMLKPYRFPAVFQDNLSLGFGQMTVNYFAAVTENFFYFANAVYREKFTLLLIIFSNLGGFGIVFLHSFPDQVFVLVVGPAGRLAAQQKAFG